MEGDKKNGVNRKRVTVSHENKAECFQKMVKKKKKVKLNVGEINNWGQP